jgi:hypothetical protein
MSREFLLACAIVSAISVLLMGCVPTPTSSGPVTRVRCPLDFHTEAFVNNPHPRRAYGCRSNQSGFLSPADGQEHMRPQ